RGDTVRGRGVGPRTAALPDQTRGRATGDPAGVTALAAVGAVPRDGPGPARQRARTWGRCESPPPRRVRPPPENGGRTVETAEGAERAPTVSGRGGAAVRCRAAPRPWPRSAASRATRTRPAPC